eukprot:Awhi_evm1s14664
MMMNSNVLFLSGTFLLLFINLFLDVNGVPFETQGDKNDKQKQKSTEMLHSFDANVNINEAYDSTKVNTYNNNHIFSNNNVNVISNDNDGDYDNDDYDNDDYDNDDYDNDDYDNDDYDNYDNDDYDDYDNDDYDNDDYDNDDERGKNVARKAKVLVDMITSIHGLSSHPIFNFLASTGLHNAENIEEELVHIGTIIRDLIPRKTSSSVGKWRVLNTLVKYFKRSGINDGGIEVPIDAKAIEHELKKLLSILETQETLQSSAAQKKMETLFDKYIQETTDAEAHEINSYKGLLYLQMGRFFIQIADILIESFPQSKFAEIFGFLGDFLILKDALVHHTDLHLLHALTRKMESENSNSKIVENIDLVIKNLMADHPKLKDGEKWTPKSLESSQMNLYLTIVENVNQDPDFLKYLKDTDDTTD